MLTRNGDELSFGLTGAVPPTAQAAWGARLIVYQHGEVDFLEDRQDLVGEHKWAFADQLAEEYPIATMKDDIARLLRSGQMSTRERRECVLYDSAQLEVRANTNASAGYCYVAAYSKEGVSIT